VNGRIVYELTGNACEGYAQNMRFVSVTSSQEGNSQETDLRTSSWEEVPARKLRFSSSTYQSDQLAEQSRGAAERREAFGPAKVELVRPERRSFEVSGNVHFPIQHASALVEAARAGKHMFTADLYDGSENGTKVYATSAAIGSRIAPGATTTFAKLKGAEKLDRVPSWPVSISYFAPGISRKDELPLYEMSYRFHENGVTSTLTLDYGEYSLNGELKELTYLDATPCAPPRQ
jgi:hypothetical protein